jgi:Ca2+-binding RTX toxin-like protein
MTALLGGSRLAGSFVVPILAWLVVGLASPATAGTPRCMGHPATIVGTGGNNQIVGTNGADVIVARGGSDSIDSKAGRDLVCAGPGGLDVVFGREGNDKVAGQDGFDVVFPGAGADFVSGGGRGAFVTYEGSSVRVLADVSSGRIVAGGKVDRVQGVDGIAGGEADDVLVGDARADSLWGFGGDDVVVGRRGPDFLNAGAGDDIVRGGRGAFDILDLTFAFGGPGLGDDVLATSGAAVDIPAGTVAGGSDVGNDLFRGIVFGTARSNFVATWDGADNVQARGGDDVIFPGPGDDVAEGGAGGDMVDYFLSDPVNPGVLGPVTVDLGAQTATGLGDDDLNSIEAAIGTLQDDTLIGSSGSDLLLLGDEGTDDISGNAGDDLLDGDIFFFGFPENLPGTDTLDGGPDQDTCLGGEVVEECEQTEPASLRSADAGTASALDTYSSRKLLVRRYELMR